MTGATSMNPGGEPLPILLAATQPSERDRVTVALRFFWCIPQFIVLFFVWIAALFVTIIGWFAALFTGELPDFARDFLSGAIRWDARVRGYFFFLTDEYPPFSLDEHPEYPVTFAIPAKTRLNPLAVFFRIILVIPAGIVVSVVGSGAFLIAVASWVTIVFTGRQPEPLYEVLRVYTRFQMRVSGYFVMVIPTYPWGIMGDMDTSEDVTDARWRLTLTPSGRTTMIVTIILGVIVEIFNRRY